MKIANNTIIDRFSPQNLKKYKIFMYIVSVFVISIIVKISNMAYTVYLKYKKFKSTKGENDKIVQEYKKYCLLELFFGTVISFLLMGIRLNQSMHELKRDNIFFYGFCYITSLIPISGIVVVSLHISVYLNSKTEEKSAKDNQDKEKNSKCSNIIKAIIVKAVKSIVEIAVAIIIFTLIEPNTLSIFEKFNHSHIRLIGTSIILLYNTLYLNSKTEEKSAKDNQDKEKSADNKDKNKNSKGSNIIKAIIVKAVKSIVEIAVAITIFTLIEPNTLSIFEKFNHSHIRLIGTSIILLYNTWFFDSKIIDLEQGVKTIEEAQQHQDQEDLCVAIDEEQLKYRDKRKNDASQGEIGIASTSTKDTDVSQYAAGQGYAIPS